MRYVTIVVVVCILFYSLLTWLYFPLVYLFTQLIAGSDLALAALSSSSRFSALLAGLISVRLASIPRSWVKLWGTSRDGRGWTGDLAIPRQGGLGGGRGVAFYLFFDSVSDTGAEFGEF